MDTNNPRNGLIFINSYFDVIIDNCTFLNNSNFAGIIHCDSSSYCNVVITNSKFENNDGLCGTGESVLNGIHLADGAYGTITIEKSLFVGFPWIYNDSTSIVTMDNYTQSMMIDTNISNSDINCPSTASIFVSNNRFVLSCVNVT